LQARACSRRRLLAQGAHAGQAANCQAQKVQIKGVRFNF
jgi:hypothetical protein